MSTRTTDEILEHADELAERFKSGDFESGGETALAAHKARMNGEPNLDELIGAPRRRGERPCFSPEVKAARKTEMLKRNNIANAMVAKAIRRLHNDDYQSLLAQAKAKVAAEFGPLPGDEVTS